jgi:hypothetical protein
MSAVAVARPAARPTATTAAVGTARWTTPALLRAALVAIWIGVLLQFGAAYAGVAGARHALKTIGRDAAPSIVAAQEIRAYLADMDADAANALLVPPDGFNVALQGVEARRQAVARRLIDAAENVTFGDEERVPIQTIAERMGAYQDLLGQVRVLQRQDPAAARVTYGEATTLMHQAILPAADALDAANQRYLDDAYADWRRGSGWALGSLFASGALLLAALVATQIFLLRRTRRLVNLPLAAATAIGLVFLGLLGAALGTDAQQLKVAKQDAFDSIGALTRARALAYDANGDESRYLLDPSRAADFERAFAARAAQLADVTDFQQAASDAERGVVPFRGLLGDELRNITFPGELEAALETLRTWGRYVAIDREIRALEQAGRHQEAVDLCLGTAEGQSNWAFAQFDATLGRLIEINQREFGRAIDTGVGALAGFDLLGPIAAIMIALLAWLGLRPRLAEYAV